MLPHYPLPRWTDAVSAPGGLEGVSAQIETATPPLEHPPVLDDGEPHAEARAQLGVPPGEQGSGRRDRDDPADSLGETISRALGPTSGFRLRTLMWSPARAAPDPERSLPPDERRVRLGGSSEPTVRVGERGEPGLSTRPRVPARRSALGAGPDPTRRQGRQRGRPNAAAWILTPSASRCAG